MTELAPDFSPIDEIEKEDIFSVDVDGFEGPLHMLLDMARRQKVDLLHVSVTELANQYLEFIEKTKAQRIDLAAEYLLMASWLAFLKSKLLLPKQTEERGDEISGDDMVAQLAFRLRRLEAMREASETLMQGPLLGQDVFTRGAPEQPTVLTQTEYDTSLWHLVQAFGSIRQRRAKEAPHKIENQYVLPLERARDSLRGLRTQLQEWSSLDDIRAKLVVADADIPARSVTASVFSAALELTRDGEVDVRQSEHFAPLYLRGKSVSDETVPQVERLAS